MYKKNTQCNKCRHCNTKNHRCDAFCSFMKDTCDDVYQQGRADKYQEITLEYMLLTEEQVAEIRADAIDECIDLVNSKDFISDIVCELEELKGNSYERTN